MNIYKIIFYKTERMYFLTKGKQFLKKYNKILKKVSNIIKKECNSKLVHNKKYLKNNLEGPKYICTSLLLIYSVCIKDKKHPKVFLIGERYNNIDIYSDDSDGGYFDE